PLIGGSQVLGVLDVQSSELDAFGDEDVYILKTLAAQIAVAIEDARLLNAQKEEAYYLNAVLQVAQNLSATTDLNEALETIVRITPLLVGVERCAIFLHDAATRAFVPAKAYGLPAAMMDALAQFHFRDDEYAFGKIFQDKKPLAIDDAASSTLFPPDSLAVFQLRALLIAPLISRGQVVGAMLVDEGARQKKFSPHETEVLMGIATQAAVAIESARLGAAAKETQRLEYELQLAHQIQKTFLPDACPTIAGYDIRAHWQSAREVSGDFYDFVSLSGGRLGITIADVSDKGMAAAMFMALSRTILRTMAIGKPTPRETIERANDVILADARSEMFVTVFYAVLDAEKNKMTYVNAGHNPPLYYRAAKKELKTLPGHGIALGVQPNVAMSEKSILLDAGDIVLFYTDGVTDAINAREEEFGDARLAKLIALNADASAEELMQRIARAVHEFAGDGAQFDDVTMVVVKRV
ncbi:MAG: SpoIIE family protein phosphatase, partial [Chloroflexi bacterium]|nr:SpoIIE family protein phosphatase [Chloroflexota bacterium]